jgi:arabinan endo-1,5-alpha-L-arabinosidase
MSFETRLPIRVAAGAVCGSQNSFVQKFLLTFMLSLIALSCLALKGNINSHDPSALIKDGSRYWMFTTGNGIYAAYSTDLIQWTSGPKTVFPIGTWPSWINSAVPGFGGNFWAPDCIYMNGKYYLYYSCSTFGSSRSAIGVATSPTLDQNSSSYGWTDLGMVVSSAVSTDINAIDPALFMDSNGKVYMSYGSFSGGIGVVEIDPATGKKRSGASVVKVAGGNGADWEAPYIVKEGSYYYLFVNRGFCCRGASSTYYIVVGRSSSPTGPFVDKSNVNLNSGGGSTVLGSSGRFIGPGHFGLLRQGGSNFVSMHYYDGNDNGNPKLDIVNMGFSSGWPFLTRDWIAAGSYRITNLNSGKVWDAWGCTGAAGQAIAQGTWGNLTCQKWTFTPVGDGNYRITCNQGGRSADIVNCNAANGAKVQLWDWLNNNCQKFEIERAADGTHVLTSLTGNRVIEVPGASTANGVQLALYDYNGNTCQRWQIASAAAREDVSDQLAEEEFSSNISVYPNPVRNSARWVVDIGEIKMNSSVSIKIISARGDIVQETKAIKQSRVSMDAVLARGLYIVQVSKDGRLIRKKILIE